MTLTSDKALAGSARRSVRLRTLCVIGDEGGRKKNKKGDAADSQKHEWSERNEAGRMLGGSLGDQLSRTNTHSGPDAQICLAVVNQSNKEI